MRGEWKKKSSVWQALSSFSLINTSSLSLSLARFCHLLSPWPATPSCSVAFDPQLILSIVITVLTYICYALFLTFVLFAQIIQSNSSPHMIFLDLCSGYGALPVKTKGKIYLQLSAFLPSLRRSLDVYLWRKYSILLAHSFTSPHNNQKRYHTGFATFHCILIYLLACMETASYIFLDSSRMLARGCMAMV